MQQLRDLHQKWQHLLSPSFFIGGFALDIFTLGRVDDLSNFFIFTFYILISFTILVFEISLLKKGGNPAYSLLPSWQIAGRPLAHWVELYKDEAFHFAQGALLSAFTLFYFKSAGVASSLLFLIILLIPLVINEFELIRGIGLITKSIFFNLTLMSFVVVYSPLPFGKVGLLIFSLGLVIYLIVVGLIFKLFTKMNIEFSTIKKYWLTPALSLALLFFGLRIIKVIPPVPLSLEYAGVFHKVEKDYPTYRLYHEKKWWRFWHSSDEYFEARPGDRPYFFASIFAPRGFEDKIYVRWLKYSDGNWRTSDRIPLTIVGGREKGFRGYTYKENYTPGDWRVSVETSGGVEIGRLSFEIVATVETSSPEAMNSEAINTERKFKVIENN